MCNPGSLRRSGKFSEQDLCKKDARSEVESFVTNFSDARRLYCVLNFSEEMLEGKKRLKTSIPILFLPRTVSLILFLRENRMKPFKCTACNDDRVDDGRASLKSSTQNIPRTVSPRPLLVLSRCSTLLHLATAPNYSPAKHSQKQDKESASP